MKASKRKPPRAMVASSLARAAPPPERWSAERFVQKILANPTQARALAIVAGTLLAATIRVLRSGSGSQPVSITIQDYDEAVLHGAVPYEVRGQGAEYLGQGPTYFYADHQELYREEDDALRHDLRQDQESEEEFLQTKTHRYGNIDSSAGSGGASWQKGRSWSDRALPEGAPHPYDPEAYPSKAYGEELREQLNVPKAELAARFQQAPTAPLPRPALRQGGLEGGAERGRAPPEPASRDPRASGGFDFNDYTRATDEHVRAKYGAAGVVGQARGPGSSPDPALLGESVRLYRDGSLEEQVQSQELHRDELQKMFQQRQQETHRHEEMQQKYQGVYSEDRVAHGQRGAPTGRAGKVGGYNSWQDSPLWKDHRDMALMLQYQEQEMKNRGLDPSKEFKRKSWLEQMKHSADDLEDHRALYQKQEAVREAMEFKRQARAEAARLRGADDALAKETKSIVGFNKQQRNDAWFLHDNNEGY